jgi:hypothetical protein
MKRRSLSSKLPSPWLAGRLLRVLGFSLVLVVTGEVLDWLPGTQCFGQVRNLREFAGMLAFDKWTCNADGRQVVFHKEMRERKYNASIIDFGYCFNAGEWSFPDAPLRGVYGINDVYVGSNRGTTLLHGCRGSSDSPRSNCSALRTRSHASGMANATNCNACWIACWSAAAESAS